MIKFSLRKATDELLHLIGGHGLRYTQFCNLCLNSSPLMVANHLKKRSKDHHQNIAVASVYIAKYLTVIAQHSSQLMKSFQFVARSAKRNFWGFRALRNHKNKTKKLEKQLRFDFSIIMVT